MDSSLPSGAEYSLAASTSAPQASPTVDQAALLEGLGAELPEKFVEPGPVAGDAPGRGSLAIWSMTSSRKPSTPWSIHQRIIS